MTTTYKQFDDAVTRLGCPSVAVQPKEGQGPETLVEDVCGLTMDPYDVAHLVAAINRSETQHVLEVLKLEEKLEEAEKQIDGLVKLVADSVNVLSRDRVIAHMASRYNKLVTENIQLKGRLEVAEALAHLFPKPINLDSYQDAALRTYVPSGSRNAELLGALGLAGEAGEVAELIKKHVFHGKEYTKEALIKELGDVLWYLAVMAATVAGVPLSVIAQTNIDKLKARYPEGFTQAKANNRNPEDK